MLPTLRLESPGLAPLSFDHRDGWIVESFELGHPEYAEVEEGATDADGTINTTELIRARDVIVSGVLSEGTSQLWAMKDRLAAFQSPKRRVDLVVHEHPDAPVKVLRSCVGVQFPRGVVGRDWDSFQAVFRAPFGILESAELHEASAFPSGEGAELGRDYDLSFDRTYPTSPVLGSRTVVNAGTIDAYPVFRIFGPVGAAPGADPQGPDTTTIRNLTTGKNLVFEDLVVAAGDYCEVDTRRKTIRINGLPEQSRYDRLKFPDSRWWTLVPGENELRFSPETSSGVAELRILWRSAWI